MTESRDIGNSPQDPAKSVEPAPQIRVSSGERHVIYDMTGPLVGAPCGRQHLLVGWQDDDPELPVCGVCGFFFGEEAR